MTDFFSRIFSIPSDDSSNYSSDGFRADDGGNNGNKNNAGSGRNTKKKKKETKKQENEGRNSRASLPPQCTTDSNDTITSSNGGTISHANNTGSDSETMEEHLGHYPYDDDDDDDDDDHDYGRHADRRALRPSGGVGSRGRQRRNGAPPVHRSASEQPRGSAPKGTVPVAAGSNLPRTPMQLQLQGSPTRRHRSLSKMRNNRPSSSGGEEEEEEEGVGGRSRERRHRSSSSSAAHKRSSSSSHRKRQQHPTKQRPDGHAHRKTAADNGATRQHEKVNWLSRTFVGVGSKKHSPGSDGGGVPHAQQGGNRRGKTIAVEEAKATAEIVRHKPRTSQGDVRDKDAKLSLPSPGKGSLRKQPINVGDSIVISQEFLEESMEMSVLTMPRELMTGISGGMSANEEVREGGGGGRGGQRDEEPITGEVPSNYANFAVDIQEVGRRTVLENDIVKAYYSNGHAGQDVYDVVMTTTGISSADGLDGPVYPRISAYATRFLEEGTNNHSIYQSFSRDQSIVHDREDGIEVSPANRFGLVTPHAGLGVRHREEEGKIDGKTPPSAGSGKHQWPCDPSADEYSLNLNGGGFPLSPPPPPPPLPPPLPRRVLSPDNIPVQLSQQQVTASCYTPVSGNSETVAASYNDPRGSLTEPTAHPPDPPGDDCRPFDNVSSGFGNGGLLFDRRAATKSLALQPMGQGNLRSPINKAVTFSLPPPKITPQHATPPPAPPLMGLALDYNYSMDHKPNKDTFWSSSQLSPPIVELWSSVECPNNMPGGTGGAALKWDTKKECDLLGEEVSLHVSEEWIDLLGKEKGKKETPTHATLTLIKTAAAPAPSAVISSWEVSSTDRHPFHSKEDLPDDEYLNDILNCDDEDLAHNTTFNSNDDRADRSPSNLFHNDANLRRHRSTWNTAYKPPNLSYPSEDSIRLKEDNWNMLIRKRANAVIAIQRCVRGMLQRQRLRLLLVSVSIIQSCIRRYISRRRFQDYLKLKRSYYPRRWERSNIALPKFEVLK